MTIAFFLPTLGGGGAERMQVHLANTLTERGHAVSLIVADAAGPVRERVSPAVRLIDLRKRRSLAALLPLARLLRRGEAPILISALTHGNLVALLARCLAPFSRSKIIVTERNAIAAELSDAAPWRRLAISILVRLIYPLADRVVGISRGVAEEVQALARLPRDKVIAINNPTITADLAEALTESPVRADLFDPELPIIATVGRLQPQKDQACLLRAFARLLQERDARLVILGEGPLRESLEDLARELGISDHVAFLGFVTKPLAFLSCCNLFVLSSRYEGLGNVLIEALYCGLPVVSTDCPHGPAEILDDGKYGRLVPVGDEAALAEAMVAALMETHDRKAQQRRALVFSAEAAADRYEALIGELQQAHNDDHRLRRRSAKRA